MLNLFRRQRESITATHARACRARYEDGPGTETVELQLIVEGGHRLDIVIPQQLVPAVIGHMTDAYEAINPPLSRRSNRAAGWAE